MASKRKPTEPSPAIAGEGDGGTADVAFLGVPDTPPDAPGAVADLGDDAPDQATPGGPAMPPPDEQPKRKRGRPKGSGSKGNQEVHSRPDPIEERKRESDVADALTGTLLMVSALVADQAPEFALAEKECRQLGMVWAPCLAPHMGSLGAALPWAVAAASTAQILLPKYSAYRRRVTSGDSITASGDDVVVTDATASPGLQAEGVGT